MKGKLCFKKISAVFLTLILIVSVSFTAFAAPIDSYSYDAWDNEVPFPAGYTVTSLLDGAKLKTGSLNAPTDLYVDSDGVTYITDTGNNRLIILEKGYQSAKVISRIIRDGKEEPLTAPGGLFVDNNGLIYITQKDLHRVICIDKNGNVAAVYGRPDSNLLEEDFEFLPIKVIRSTNDSVFILSEGYFYGAFTYDRQGEFVGFYGSNKVEVTVQVLLDYAWKKILSKEQQAKMARYVPIAYVSFDIDKNNFIYTCTQTTKNSKNELRKLNSLGSDVINFYDKNLSATVGNFGDLKTSYLIGKSTDTQFVDVCVDKDGIINGLDYARGRVFQYNSEGRLLNIFGGTGTDEGFFTSAAAIDDNGEDILVLDREKGSVTVFSPTEYTKLLHRAVALYEDGLYSESKPFWERLIDLNVNCEMAYAGLGKALYSEGKYEEAMDMAKLGYDRDGYSVAFKAERENILRKGFPVFATVLFVLVLAIAAYIFIRLIILKKPFVKKEKVLTPIRRIGRTLFHPMDEFYNIKDTNSWCFPASLVILLLWFLFTIVSNTLTGFIFNYNRPEDTNIIYYFASTCILFVLFVVINWSVTTLTDGKGSMYQIFVACSYALIPYIGSIAVNTVFSNIFVAEEAVFYSFIGVVGILWSALILVGALRAIHDFTFSKTIICIILTVAGMLFVLFLLVLFVSLVQQFTTFVTSVFNELLYRS